MRLCKIVAASVVLASALLPGLKASAQSGPVNPREVDGPLIQLYQIDPNTGRRFDKPSWEGNDPKKAQEFIDANKKLAKSAGYPEPVYESGDYNTKPAAPPLQAGSERNRLKEEETGLLRNKEQLEKDRAAAWDSVLSGKSDKVDEMLRKLPKMREDTGAFIEQNKKHSASLSEYIGAAKAGKIQWVDKDWVDVQYHSPRTGDRRDTSPILEAVRPKPEQESHWVAGTSWGGYVDGSRDGNDWRSMNAFVISFKPDGNCIILYGRENESPQRLETTWRPDGKNVVLAQFIGTNVTVPMPDPGQKEAYSNAWPVGGSQERIELRKGWGLKRHLYRGVGPAYDWILDYEAPDYTQVGQ